MSTSSKEKTLSKKAEPTISNLPNLVIKSVKSSLCNKDGQLVHVPILLFLTAYIPNHLICQDYDSVILFNIYPVSQKNAVHFSYCLTILPYLLSFFYLKNKYLTIFISTWTDDMRVTFLLKISSLNAIHINTL